MKDYKVVSEIPPGWTISQRDNARRAMLTLGVQSNVQPALKMHIRPHETAWLLAGDLYGVTRAEIVAAIAAELGITENAVDAKIAITDYDHAEILEFIKVNGWDDEPV